MPNDGKAGDGKAGADAILRCLETLSRSRPASEAEQDAHINALSDLIDGLADLPDAEQTPELGEAVVRMMTAPIMAVAAHPETAAQRGDEAMGRRMVLNLEWLADSVLAQTQRAIETISFIALRSRNPAIRGEALESLGNRALDNDKASRSALRALGVQVQANTDSKLRCAALDDLQLAATNDESALPALVEAALPPAMHEMNTVVGRHACEVLARLIDDPSLDTSLVMTIRACFDRAMQGGPSEVQGIAASALYAADKRLSAATRS